MIKSQVVIRLSCAGEGYLADQCGRVVGLWQAPKCVLLVCKVLYIFVVCKRLKPSVIMGTVLGTGDIITITAGAVGNDEEHCSAWLCREVVLAHDPSSTIHGGSVAKLLFREFGSL